MDTGKKWTLFEANGWRSELLNADALRGCVETEFAHMTRLRLFAGAEARTRCAGKFFPPNVIALHHKLSWASAVDTLAHELAHALEYADDADAYAREDHGAGWRKWMKRLGYPNPGLIATHDLPELSRHAFGGIVYRYDCGDCRATIYSCRNLLRCNNTDCGSSDIMQRVADPAELRGDPKII